MTCRCQLLYLIENQKNEELKSVVKNKNLYNAVDSQMNRLLHYAAEYENSEIVQFLIDSGSEVNAENDLGETPLIKSMKSDLPCAKVIKMLLEAGADVCTADTEGLCAMDIVNNTEWLTKDVRRFEILKVFLEQIKNLNLFDDVLLCGNKDVIKSLLDTNIVINNLSRDNHYTRTLVHQLAANGNPGVIEQLRGRNYDVNIRDEYGSTPLMNAAIESNPDAVEFLLNEGADIEATDDRGETSLYIAFHCPHEKQATRTVQILLEHGANVQVETANRLKTVFDMYPTNFAPIHQLPLAHLALQEARGTTITSLIRSTLNSNHQYESYFEDCKRKLSIKYCSSITLFDLLTASERQLERWFRNEELALKLADLQTSIEYFDTVLHKRFAKARKMIELRKIAAQILCQLVQSDYAQYPHVIEQIAGYLEEQDIECLKLIENELY